MSNGVSTLGRPRPRALAARLWRFWRNTTAGRTMDHTQNLCAARPSRGIVEATGDFRWIPNTPEVRGCKLTRDLAREATSPDRQVPSGMKLRSKANRTPLTPYRERRQQLEARHGGRYTKQLDRAFPGNHTRKLHDNLKREDAQILAQLRTGKNRLNSAL